MVAKRTKAEGLTDDHRKRLRKLGVLPAQLARIENLIPLCRAYLLVELPTKTDVLDEIDRLASCIEDASRAVDRMTNQATMAAALGEAHARVLLAAHHLEMQWDVLERALSALENVRAMIERARLDLSLEQQRRRCDARTEPLALIDRALLDGWSNRPAYPFDPLSFGKQNRFAEAVAVCYEAIAENRELGFPERALKAYRKALREEQARRRARK